MYMDFLAVTQQAAIAASLWIGKGRKQEADEAGTAAMRENMNRIGMRGRIVIGEGEMDEAPMLYIGEQLGTGQGPEVDIAVDPVEGTSLMAKGQDNAIAAIAASSGGSLLHAPDMYMKKLAVGPQAAGRVHLDWPMSENVLSVADALGKKVSEVTVMIQDRPRHERLIREVLDTGARVRLFSDGDVTGAIATALEECSVDMLAGTGGAPEGVLAAAALRCLGGDFQAQLLPQHEGEVERCIQMGLPKPGTILTLDDMVRSDDCLFVATGITDGMLLQGVRRRNGAALTHSFIAYRGSHARYQFIESYH
ncbi:fructose 1,6-bisphosphatase [Paenibacillus dendritiformis]|uniref:class II fructose-bisphosphatase n=1 Tax=Paenibacillus dendritiformis TaxID=130049 RepID=UPI0018CCEEA1|nr:class II fructose-bisphosphatase [Paenibacillus dendritiformis]MBG9792068.1 fructose 1,6-bisphosphatase [Paenibacillus dendritiformis]